MKTRYVGGLIQRVPWSIMKHLKPVRNPLDTPDNLVKRPLTAKKLNRINSWFGNETTERIADNDCA